MTSVTSRWRGAGSTPHPLTKAHGPLRAVSPGSLSQGAISSFFSLRSRRFATQRRSAGDSETSSRGWGKKRGGGDSHRPGGPRAGDVLVPAGALRGRAPPRARTKLRAGGGATQAPQHPSRSPGLASRRAPTQTNTCPGRTHPRPYPPLDASPLAPHPPLCTYLGRTHRAPHPPQASSTLAGHPPVRTHAVRTQRGRTHQGPHLSRAASPPRPRIHAVRTYPGRRSRRSARSLAAAAAPGRPSAAPWPWQRCPETPEPGRGRGVSTPLR